MTDYCTVLRPFGPNWELSPHRSSFQGLASCRVTKSCGAGFSEPSGVSLSGFVRPSVHRLSPPPPKFPCPPKKTLLLNQPTAVPTVTSHAPGLATRLPPTSFPLPSPLSPLCVSPRRQTSPPPSRLPPPLVSSASRQSRSSASPGVAQWRRWLPRGVCDGADPQRHEGGFCVGVKRNGKSATRTGGGGGGKTH